MNNKNLQEKGRGKDSVGVVQLKKILERAFESAIWRIERWASEADKKAGKTYSKKKALRLFGAPQFTTFEGNVLLNSGINELFTLICSTTGTRWDNAIAQLGVGAGTTAELATQTSLQIVRVQTAWVASIAYALGAIVRPVSVGDANEFIYECTTAGTSGTAEPTWPTTDGATVTSGTAVFTARKRIEFQGQMAGFPTFGTAQRSTWRASFGGTVANFAWNEFAVRNGATALRCLNRRMSAQGSKVAGAIWEISLEITLS